MRMREKEREREGARERDQREEKREKKKRGKKPSRVANGTHGRDFVHGHLSYFWDFYSRFIGTDIPTK